MSDTAPPSYSSVVDLRTCDVQADWGALHAFDGFVERGQHHDAGVLRLEREHRQQSIWELPCNTDKEVSLNDPFIDTIQYVLYDDPALHMPKLSPMSRQQCAKSPGGPWSSAPSSRRPSRPNTPPPLMPPPGAAVPPHVLAHLMAELQRAHSPSTAADVATMHAATGALDLGGAPPIPSASVVVRQHAPYQSMGRTQVIPRGLESTDRILVIPYQSYGVTSDPAQYRADGTMRRAAAGRDPHLKLGGVWMDVSPSVIAALIEFVTSIRVANVDMFLHNQGRCALHLFHEATEGPMLIDLLDRRLWMGPTVALYASTPSAIECLKAYVQRLRQESGASSLHWPRHMLTVERWLPKATYDRLPIRYRRSHGDDGAP